MPELSVDAGSTSAGLTLSHWSGQWWFRAMGVYSASTGNFLAYTGLPCRGPAQGGSAVATGLVGGYTYGFKAYGSYAACAADLSLANSGDDSGATGVLGAAPVKATTLGTPTLDARAISGGGARLTVGNWSKSDGDWWYRANVVVPHANSPLHGASGCRGPVTGGNLRHDDRNLPALAGTGAYYVFTAYPTAGCDYPDVAAYAKISSAPAINIFTVGNLSRSIDGQRGITAETPFGGRFVTGGAGPYTLTSVTISSSTPTGSPGRLTVAVYDDANGRPGASLTTLIGPNSPGPGDHEFTCTSDCALAKNETYYVVLSAPGAPLGSAHMWNYTNLLLEDRTPAGNGWSIGDKAYRGDSGAWYEVSNPAQFKVTAETQSSAVTLAASNVAAWSATLTITGHPGSWYYKANAAPHASCSGPAHGASEALTGLTASTSSYVYTAYSDSACANALATASSFSTPDPPPDRIDSVTVSRGDGTLILSWTAPADNGSSITQYDVEYRASSATTWTSGGTSTTTSKTISGVTDATPYAVRVRAVNANGNAEWREASVGAR